MGTPSGSSLGRPCLDPAVEGESAGCLLEPGCLLAEPPREGRPSPCLCVLSAWLWARLRVKQAGSHINTVTPCGRCALPPSI